MVSFSNQKAARLSKPPPPQIKIGEAFRVTLGRLLSKVGIASRTKAHEWIRAGRIAVGGRIVRNPSLWVAWPRDRVTLDGVALEAATRRLILYHKPKGLITTHHDEQGRQTIFDVLPPDLRTLHAVGRLDQASSGLLLLTNDTALSAFLADPTNAIPRIYLVTVRGHVSNETVQRAIDGIVDDQEHLSCKRIEVQKRSKRESHLKVTLIEGKNREIRRLCRALGHEVTRLRRICFGPFELGTLAPGEWIEASHARGIQMVIKKASVRQLG
ncbi:pseudouridine synthase [Nitrospira sp.]|nr:pseudouridine synthase [Nitrospira sp.]